MGEKKSIYSKAVKIRTDSNDVLRFINSICFHFYSHM